MRWDSQNDDQKFLPVSLHEVKQNFFSLRQGTMANAEYLEKFNNHVDITLSYDGEILNVAVLENTRNKMHPNTDPTEHDAAEIAIVHVAAKELCLTTAFLLQCDRRCYGKLLEELENDFTKGHNKYPSDMVKGYQLLMSTGIGDLLRLLHHLRASRLLRKANRKAAQTKTGRRTRPATNAVRKDTPSQTVPNSRRREARAAKKMMPIRKPTRKRKRTKKR
jgi:hypothetical protein